MTRTARPLAYISGPISKGDRADHITRAVEAFRWLIELGYAPHCPQLSIYAEDWHGARFPHATWMEIDLAWLIYADLIVRLEGESVGADIEVREAGDLGLPVVYLERTASRRQLADLIVEATST
jgi:hypothetical protein